MCSGSIKQLRQNYKQRRKALNFKVMTFEKKKAQLKEKYDYIHIGEW